MRKSILVVILTLLAIAALALWVYHRAATPTSEAGPPAPTKSLPVKQGATAADLGVEFYPGAKVTKSGMLKGPKGTVGGAELQTSDAPDKVATFYAEKYKELKPTGSAVAGPPQALMLSWHDGSGECTVVIKRDEAAKQTLITLARNNTESQEPSSPLSY